MSHRPRSTKPRCPVTGNVMYGDKIAAELALAKIQRLGPRRGQPEMKRSYDCGHCRKFHLTPEELRAVA